jgi:hypothetical protein
VTFYKNVATVAVHPAMGDPVLAGMGRTVPAAGNPDIAGAIPAVIAIDPDVSVARDWTACLNNGGGRSYADHDLRKRGGRQQSGSEQQSWKKFLHVR